MRGVHIPGGQRTSVALILPAGCTATFLRSVSLVFVLAVALGTAACVGVTGKPATGEPAGGDGVSVTPTSMNFGNVNVNSSVIHSFTLANTSSTAVTVTNVNGEGMGYHLSGLSAPLALDAGASVTFTIKFAPVMVGTEAGTFWITTSASSSPLTISLAADGVAAPGGTPAIEVTPASVNFGNVTVGSKDSQTMRVSNTGTADLTITKIAASGTGFSVSGLSIPTTLPPGENTTFTSSFKPTGTGNQTGSISISSNAAGSPLAIDLTASGVTTVLKLAANATSLNFGTVNVGVTTSQTVTLTNTGNANVVIENVTASGTGFGIAGGPSTLTPSQSIAFTVTFDPKAPGGVTGNLFVTSNAPTVQVGLTGQGAGTVVAHSVSLDWAPSVSVVMGYNVYRGLISGGPYMRINPAVDSATSYTDSAVSGGLTYFYVVTAIDSSKIESGFSNQVSVTIPQN
jgi:Abnormal spindle-like microcephaly-assoc'd, ASPM-SPD-2-Hydin